MDTIIALLTIINSYRMDHKLPVLRLDSALNVTAKAHAIDFCTKVKDGNGHTWSDGSTGQRACDKAVEYGYPIPAAEIAHYHYPDPYTKSCTPVCAFKDWIASPEHDDVILEKGEAQDFHWRACGIYIYKGFACVWFGEVSIRQ